MTAASGLVHMYIPSPDQGVWHVGPIPIRAYALCIIVGIIVAIWWGSKRYLARGGRPGTITDIAVWAVPFGLVGGRLYHVCTDWWRYFGPGKNPLGALQIWDGGLGIPGAIALGGVGVLIACRRKGIPMPFVADALAPGIVTAQAIGRIGNYFNQELYGDPTKLPWGLEIFNRVNPSTGLTDYLNGVAVNHNPVTIVHPTFLYELIWDLIVAVFVVLADRILRLGHGRAFALYVAGYAFGRFFIELMRSDQATLIFGVRVNVWMMTLLFIGGIVYFVLARSRGPREDPATFPAHQLPMAAAPAEAEASTEPGAPAEGDETTEKPAEDPVEKAESTEPGEAEEPEEAEKKAEEKAEPAATISSGPSGTDTTAEDR